MKNTMKSCTLIAVISLMTFFSNAAFAQGKDCDPMPEGLTEINREQAEQMWSNYANTQKAPCISGTWTDVPFLTYLSCLSKTALYSGIAKNNQGCLFVIWATEEQQGENKIYRYFALRSDLECSDPNRIGNGVCPTRCP